MLFSLQVPYASGGFENRYKHIDELIARKDYNHALVLLEEYIHKNPDDFDNAQRRIKKIMNARGDYNGLAEDLIDVIINDPTNDIKKLEMISHLEQMEINPNIGAQSFISQTKVAAQFTYFRARFEKIMQDGSALVKDGKYTEAAYMFFSGFELYRDDFYAQGYDSTFLNPINASLRRVESMLLEYRNVQTRLDDSAATFTAAVYSGNFIRSQTAFTQLNAAMRDFASIRNAIAESGWLFQNSFGALVEKNPAITEASYLPFVYRFTLGRASDPSTGIIGAMDAQWDTLMTGMKKTTYEAVMGKWVLAFSRLGSANVLLPPALHQEARLDIADGTSFSHLAIQLNDLYALLEKSTGVPLEGSYPEYSSAMKLSQTFAAVTLNELDVIHSFGDLTQKSASYVLPAAAAADIQSGKSEQLAFFIRSADSFLQYVNQSDKNLREVDGAYTAYQNGFGTESPDFSNVYGNITKLCSQVITVSEKESAQSMLKLATYIRNGSDEIAALYEKNYVGAQELLSGITDVATGKVNRYPSQTVNDIQASLSSIQKDMQTLRGLHGRLSQAVVVNSSRREYDAQLGEIQRNIASLESVQSRGKTLVVRAEEQLLLAGKAIQEAEMRYNQAVAAIPRAEYQLARDSLQLARQRYNQALDIQESAQLRASADAKLAALGVNITRAENEVVITQVRSLITQAKTAYYAGNFENADRFLNQARTRWEITNVDPNLEIIQWLTLTGTAISRKTGRTIPVTAPLYPEMSQLLSVANQLYDQGSALMAAGKKSESIITLNAAKQKIREVQLVYPVNQEAGLLALKIDKLIDPRAFDTSFKNRFDQAMRDYKKTETQQTSYADLLDLAQINPNYPGLKTGINTVEIYLGIKLPPPDPRTAARSSTLIAQAKTAANSTNEIELRTALARLDEALKLTPDNEEAAILKDRMQSRIGGQAIAVLSSESERLYQQAVQELQRNNIINAAALLVQLMQNPNNRKSPKVLDLQQRINTLTGQVN